MNLIKQFTLILVGIFTLNTSFSQDSLSTEETYEEEEPKTFSGTRIINGHSVETLGKGFFEMRIEHRFGDVAGKTPSERLRTSTTGCASNPYAK